MQLSQVAGNGTKGKHAIHDVQHLSMLSDLFQLLLTTLFPLSYVPITGPMNITAEELLKDLATDGDENKQGLYISCIQNGPSLHSWKVSMPLPDSSSLIDLVQNKPSVEPALRKYQRRRLQEQEQRHSVYIPPQAKATRESSDDDLFDLTTKVNEFVDSDGDTKVLLLLGDSGAGKSTFNLELERNLRMAYNTDKRWIPVFVTLPAIDRPDKDLIAKQLRSYDFTEDQIRELKSYRQFVLICDGYDECQKKDNLYNDNRLNQPGERIVKMIISCRSEFFGSDYRLFFQPGGRNDRLGAMQLKEAVVAPFSVIKISDYIRSYVSKYQSRGDTTWKAEDYESAIKNIPNLQELVKNPFLLSLALEVLPRLVDLSKNFTSSKISRVTLYDQFVEQWLERGQKRLIERSPVHADPNRLLVLHRDLDHRPEVVVVLASDRAVARIDAVLCQRLCALRILGQQLMSVVVEVANDRRVPALLGQRLDDVRNRLCGIVVVHRDAHHLGARARERRDLLHCALDIGGIGVRHRLHDDRSVRAGANAPNVDGYGTAASDIWHIGLKGKFTIALPRYTDATPLAR